MLGRLDVAFNNPTLWRDATTGFEKLPLRKIVARAFSGGTPSTSNREYWGGDIPWLSPKDFNDFDIQDTEDHLSEAGLKAASLELADPGSVFVVVRSGILKHSLPVALSRRRMAVNQDIKVLVLRDPCIARYLAWYLHVFQKQILPLITKHSTTVQSVNTREFESLTVPMPPPKKRTELIAGMDKAWTERKTKLAQATALLTNFDDFLIKTFNLIAPPKDMRRVFAVHSRDVSPRFDPHFHAPEFAHIQEMLSHMISKPLGSFVLFSHETWSPQNHEEPTFRYIEINTVDPKTGEVSWSEVKTKEAPSRARMKVRAGDIIVSLTRPHHGSIALLGKEFEGCIASTGFAVIRHIAAHVDPTYLCCVLRARFCLRQMLQRSSGGNYPAITESELSNVVIPVPEYKVQESIAMEVRRLQGEATKLRTEAETGWQAAKLWFEQQLLGTADLQASNF